MLGVFSSKTPIAPSRGFSVETLTGVTPLWKTESDRSISANGIPRGLQHCHKTCCKKDGCHRRQYYKLQTLELVKRINLVLRLTQENSIENSVQDYLPYMQIPNGLCKLFLSYPKQPCICLKVNMCITCCIILSFQNLLHPSMCHMTCDHII